MVEAAKIPEYVPPPILFPYIFFQCHTPGVTTTMLWRRLLRRVERIGVSRFQR